MIHIDSGYSFFVFINTNISLLIVLFILTSRIPKAVQIVVLHFS